MSCPCSPPPPCLLVANITDQVLHNTHLSDQHVVSTPECRQENRHLKWRMRMTVPRGQHGGENTDT
jgi:hypothetical protein